LTVKIHAVETVKGNHVTGLPVHASMVALEICFMVKCVNMRVTETVSLECVIEPDTAWTDARLVSMATCVI